jgi:pimeloyl-ACP methyl ester carboxylesterase
VSITVACAAAKPAGEQLRFVQGPAGRLRVSDGGQGGIPVVFVHGLTGDISTWQFQLAHLRATRRALALELRGHGESDPPRDGDWSMEALADDIDACTRELPRFVLVGHSMSGVALQIFAARHPGRLKGLVFVDAIGSFQALSPESRASLLAEEREMGLDSDRHRAAIESLLGQQARPATRQQVLASFERVPPEGFHALRMNLYQFVPPADVRAAGVPLFAIEVERPRQSPIFFSSLAPEAPRKTIPNVSHWVMLDDPNAFDAALDGFLATLKE